MRTDPAPAEDLAFAIAYGAVGSANAHDLRIACRDPEALAADIRAIADRAAAHIKRPYLDHAEFLYDEHGLPK